MSPRHIKARCHTTYVRPTLKYASTLWDPSTQKSCTKLETVQRRSDRFVFNDYDRQSSVTTMIGSLKWPLLQQRRANAKAVLVYRIVNGLVAIPANKYLVVTGSQTRWHETRFINPFTRVQAYKHSFFPSAIRIWNTLPAEIVGKQYLKSFRDGLSRKFCNAPLK